MEACPIHNVNGEGMLTFQRDEAEAHRSHWVRLRRRLGRVLFAGVPENYPLRMKVSLMLNASMLGFYWELSQTVLSLIACLLYIIDTYEAALEAVGMWPDLMLCIAFTIDFFVQWYAASHRGWFLLTANAVVDLLTIVPVYIDIGLRGIMPQGAKSEYGPPSPHTQSTLTAHSACTSRDGPHCPLSYTRVR